MNDQHPDHLLWFVAGQVEAAERASIMRHLESCEDCRTEAASFASMMKSLVAQTHLDHVGAEDLVVFEESAPRTDLGKVAQVQRHLEECADCREDLDTVSRAHERERASPRSAPRIAPPLRFVGRDIPAIPPSNRRSNRGKTPKRGRLVAAAAGIVVLIALGVTGLTRTEQGPSGPVALKLVVLGAPQRGVESAAVFEAPGPWAARVILPYGTEPQGFRVTIRREPRTAIPGFDAVVTSDNESCLDLIVPELPSAGRYEMVLTPLSAAPADGSEDLVYSFEYVASARAPRAG